ncbi:MAG: type II toxin-antitoxin system Phd/YefM family antitoxin [Treponema sp.]|jgi:antitoxin Phd|nr:type II toxin-antitoxin system Phd/YefM family antitoxin [Treponema sp.]
MKFSSKNICSILDANQNFSRIAQMADQQGAVIIMKHNTPQYVLLPFKKIEKAGLIPDEDLFAISDRLMEENQKVYEALAK